MPTPVIFSPLLTTNPVGWAILGTAGYLVYKSGKKSAMRSEDDVEKECLADRSIKGAMKTAYKAKMKMDDSLSKTKEKYSGMWSKARNEVDDSSS